MDDLTLLIKNKIKDKYSSTRRFAEHLNIPQTTVVSAIKNGVNGTAFSTVVKMCNALDIKFIGGIYPVEINDATVNLVSKLSNLDEKGLHTVTTVLEMEYIRCAIEANTVAIAENNSRTEPEKLKPIIDAEQVPAKSAVSNLLKSITDL